MITRLVIVSLLATLALLPAGSGASAAQVAHPASAPQPNLNAAGDGLASGRRAAAIPTAAAKTGDVAVNNADDGNGIQTYLTDDVRKSAAATKQHGNNGPVLPEEILGKPGTLRIIGTTYPTDSVIVAKDVVTQAPYDADPTGASDAAAAFQRAMDDAAKAGGGTVFVPAGTYRFDHPITVPTGVMLRGDWKQPANNDESVGGSVLAIDYAGAPFLGMTSGASADDLTFWYPQQSLTQPMQGTAVGILPARRGQDGKAKNTTSVTLRNLTFVNPWIAINTTTSMTGSDKKTADTGGGHAIEHVYGSALHTFMVLRKTSNNSQNEENHLAATYWSGSGLPGAPAYADLAAYMHQHATGIVYDDNWGSYNLTIDDFGTGIAFTGANNSNQVTGQRIVGLVITGANKGIDIETGNNFYVNNGSISATAGTNPVAIYVDKGMSQSMLLLNEVTLKSGGDGIDDESPVFGVSVAGSVFDSWTGYALKATGGDVILEGSKFNQRSAADTRDIVLGAAVTNARMLGNAFAGPMAMDSAADPRRVYTNNSALSLPALGLSGFPSSGLGTAIATPAPPKPARTGPDSLYDVTAYGAASDCTSKSFSTTNGSYTGGCTDNTAAFQKALDAAGAAGGGTVYIPNSPGAGGYFLAGHLALPQGVELLGAEQDHKFRPNETRVLLIVEGDASPFITLGAEAGVRGFTIWYANQNGYCYTSAGKALVAVHGATCPPPFGYTVQARGPGDWAINLSLPNDTYGLDFGTYGSDHHYISGVGSQGFLTALYVSKSTDGFILDEGESAGGGGTGGPIDFPAATTAAFANPLGDLYSEGGAPKPDGVNDGHVGQVADNYAYSVGILLGSAERETLLDCYIHGPEIGLKTVADDGDGPSFTLIHYGTETFTGMDLEALDPAGAKIVSSEYHTIAQDGYPQGGLGPIAGDPYLIVGKAVAPTTPITFFNCANHAYTPIGFALAGGRTIVEQYLSDLQDNDAGKVQAAIAVQGASTGFALLGAKFINAFSGNFITNADGSPHVAAAAIILPGNNPNRGRVDTSLMGPASAATSPAGGGGDPRRHHAPRHEGRQRDHHNQVGAPPSVPYLPVSRSETIADVTQSGGPVGVTGAGPAGYAV